MHADIDENALFDELMADEVPKVPEPAPKQEEDLTPEAVQAKTEPEPPKAEPAEEVIDVTSLPPSVRKRLEEADELKTKLTNLSKDYAAVQGRLAPTQRQLAELQRHLSESAKAQPGPNTATPTEAAAVAAHAVGKTPEEWARYAEEYPEDAKAVQAYVAAQVEAQLQQLQQRDGQRTQAQQQRIDQLERQLAAFQPVIQSAHQQVEIGQLTEAHPDWREINEQPEFWDFVAKWVERLPPHLRQHVDLDRDLNRADFTIPLLADFKASRQAPPAAPTPTRQQAATTAAHRLATAPSVRGAPPPRQVTHGSINEAELFDALWEGSR